MPEIDWLAGWLAGCYRLVGTPTYGMVDGGGTWGRMGEGRIGCCTRLRVAFVVARFCFWVGVVGGVDVDVDSW